MQRRQETAPDLRTRPSPPLAAPLKPLPAPPSRRRSSRHPLPRSPSPGPLQLRRRRSRGASEVPQMCARPAAAGNADLFQRDVYANGAKPNREHEHSHLSTRPLITPLHTQVYTRTHKRTRRGFRRSRLVTKPPLDYLEVIFPAWFSHLHSQLEPPSCARREGPCVPLPFGVYTRFHT